MEYRANEVAADQKYKGKTLHVIGRVARVEKGMFGIAHVRLIAGAGSGVVYYVPQEKAINLQPTERLDFVGICDGASGGEVVIRGR